MAPVGCRSDTMPRILSPGRGRSARATAWPSSRRLTPPSLCQGHPSLLGILNPSPSARPSAKASSPRAFPDHSLLRLELRHCGYGGAVCTPPHMCPAVSLAPHAPALMVSPDGKGPVILPPPDGFPSPSHPVPRSWGPPSRIQMPLSRLDSEGKSLTALLVSYPRPDPTGLQLHS